MSEKINVDSSIHENPALHMAIRAITMSGSEIPVHPGRGYIEVEFKINGVDVPFEKTIRSFSDQLDQHVKEEAAKLVSDTVQLKGFDELQEKIDNALWQVKEKLQEIFGVKLED